MADIKEECKSSLVLGFCVDIGAKSVFGKRELTRLLHSVGKFRRQICRSENRFRFGDMSFLSIGQISLPLPTPPGVPSIVLDIVEPEIPALLGMNVLDRHRLVADTVFHRLARRSACELEDGRMTYIDERFIPLIRAPSRDVYVPFDKGAQLHKLHRQFFHPSAGKLFNLLRKARPEHATPETLKILNDISM